MRLRLYLDTSVLGALADPGPEERLVPTRGVLAGLAKGLWEGYISTLVLEEVERAPKTAREMITNELRKGFLTVLGESDESVRLAEKYVSAGTFPSDYEDDARHVAIASVFLGVIFLGVKSTLDSSCLLLLPSAAWRVPCASRSLVPTTTS